MRIAHVCSEYKPAISGVGQVVEELAKRQAKQGNEVHVYAPDWDKKRRIRKKEDVIEYYDPQQTKVSALIGIPLRPSFLCIDCIKKKNKADYNCSK